MAELTNDELRQAVRQQYDLVANGAASGCGSACCGASSVSSATTAQNLGYTAQDIAVVPAGANMGLGCGNPQAIARLKPGEIVLDLGSGGGFDCFLAAQQVGETGQVIGVDMSPAMISKARASADRGGYRNVEFRLGEIEHLPVADGIVDVVMSNCVINLSPDKARVYADAFRVLKPGGRLAIEDVVAFVAMPEATRRDIALYTGCLAGAATVFQVEEMLRASGFTSIRIAAKDESQSIIREWAPGMDSTASVRSASIEALKP